MDSLVRDAGMKKAYELVNQRRQQCGKCRYQVSLTSGTILHRTKTPLIYWYGAAYLMTTDKRGVSALLLQPQLGLACYEHRMDDAAQAPPSNGAQCEGTFA